MTVFLFFLASLTLGIDFRENYRHFWIDFRASNTKLAFEILKILIVETSFDQIPNLVFSEDESLTLFVVWSVLSALGLHGRGAWIPLIRVSLGSNIIRCRGEKDLADG